jgi:hypothetical protein
MVTVVAASSTGPRYGPFPEPREVTPTCAPIDTVIGAVADVPVISAVDPGPARTPVRTSSSGGALGGEKAALGEARLLGVGDAAGGVEGVAHACTLTFGWFGGSGTGARCR